MPTEAQKKANAKYRRENVKQMTLQFFPADMDVYEHIQAQDGKAAYIKRLIREDMERGRG